MTHAIERFGAAARAAHNRLTRYDQLSGDGDFGDNLRAGVDQVLQAVEQRPDDDAYAVAAQVFLDEVGGTSGPLLGLLFQSLAAARREGNDAWLESGLREGTAAIQRVGEAEIGDRTLVDALVPAVDALHGSGTVEDAAEASLRAALATADLVARRGRTSYVGERAVGVPDPGAVGVALLLWALAHEVEPDDVGPAVLDLLPEV